jgi:hypothetical protein
VVMLWFVGRCVARTVPTNANDATSASSATSAIGQDLLARLLLTLGRAEAGAGRSRQWLGAIGASA